MKKLVFIAALVAFSIGANAQVGDKSAVIKAGYQTESGRLGLGVQGRYTLTESIRLAPEVMFYLPKDKMAGMDINLNAQYVYPIQTGLNIYGLAGLAIANNRISSSKSEVAGVSFETKSMGFTDFGVNLGVGADYSLSATNFVTAEFVYTANDAGTAVFSLGYGFKF